VSKRFGPGNGHVPGLVSDWPTLAWCV
jgi:hypothetical protein